MNATREWVREYAAKHPKATVREIMAACGASSTSVVAHHLRALKYATKSDADLIRENETLSKRVKVLERIIAKASAALDENGAKQ